CRRRSSMRTPSRRRRTSTRIRRSGCPVSWGPLGWGPRGPGSPLAGVSVGWGNAPASSHDRISPSAGALPQPTKTGSGALLPIGVSLIHPRPARAGIQVGLHLRRPRTHALGGLLRLLLAHLLAVGLLL